MAPIFKSIGETVIFVVIFWINRKTGKVYGRFIIFDFLFLQNFPNALAIYGRLKMSSFFLVITRLRVDKIVLAGQKSFENIT